MDTSDSEIPPKQPDRLLTDGPVEWLLTVAEFARLLGCGRSHIYNLISQGSISYCDLAPEGATKRNLRIPVSQARAYIASITIPARTSDGSSRQ